MEKTKSIKEILTVETPLGNVDATVKNEKQVPYFLKWSPGTLDFMTSSDGETNQGGTLFKGGHYFPSSFLYGETNQGGKPGPLFFDFRLVVTKEFNI